MPHIHFGPTQGLSKSPSPTWHRQAPHILCCNLHPLSWVPNTFTTLPSLSITRRPNPFFLLISFFIFSRDEVGE
eukprot:c29843_g1_i1 orf=75-296(+)